MVDFTATWCGPCKRIAPVYAQMAEELSESAELVKVDVDENSETAQACDVACMPTFQLFKNGEVVDKLEGADEGKLRELITKHTDPVMASPKPRTEVQSPKDSPAQTTD